MRRFGIYSERVANSPQFEQFLVEMRGWKAAPYSSEHTRVRAIFRILRI
jgi:hypothetical protein